MNTLRELGLIHQDTKASEIFQYLVPSFPNVGPQGASQYVKGIWDNYLATGKSSKNLNGAFFELIIATLFLKEGLMPLHLQARLAFVPNAVYDIMLITDKNIPLAFSLKTSLRERYKQADLEGIVLKNVHRRAKSTLITLDEQEARGVKRKIETGDVVGLDRVVVATQEELDDLILELKESSYIGASSVELITAQRIARR